MRVQFGLLMLSVAALPATVVAQTYPNKPIRIVTAGAGGGSDQATRLIAPHLATLLGQQVIVDNRGLLAADVAAKAPPDGYTLLLSGGTLWLLRFMRDHVSADISDFTPVSLATETANILVVHPALPAKSVKELIALAAARPGQLNYATSGTGNSVHIAAELFKSMTRLNVVRINYKGASQALTELMSGQTQYMFGVPGSVTPHVSAGRLRAIAVTSAKPTPLAPGLPTVSATLPDYEQVSRLAIFAPAGTPSSIVARVSQDIVTVLNRQDVREKFHATGVEAVGSSPEGLGALVKAEMERMGKVIREAGIRAD